MVRLVLGLIGIVVVIMFVNAQKIDAPVSASSINSALPAAQRTAIHAPAIATKSAGDSLARNANADAAAQEVEAARVYAQAQADEQVKRVAVATQQAAFATTTANDIAISKEYATVAAIALQATSESISRTIAYDSEQYHASIALIQATKQAAQVQAYNEATKTNSTDSIGYFWTWIPTAAALILFSLFVLVLWKLIGRITPRIETVEIEVPVTPTTQASDPIVDKMNGINFTSADPRVLLTNIVTYSGRELGWLQQRIAGSDEIGSAISARAWTNAIKWGKDHYDIVTQQGPVANGGGTYAQIDMRSLKNKLILDPPFIDTPTPPSA